MNQFYQLIFRSFEEQLAPHEQQLLHHALQTNPQLKAEYDNLLKLRTALANQQFDFEPHFAERVMQAVAIQAMPKNVTLSFDAQLTIAFKRLAAASAAAIIILLGVTYYQHQSLSVNAITGLNKYNPDDIELLYTIDI
ncbi:MAG TPA: hypothetical protein PK239_05110 [Chitinophagales bacterium]|nr:hypothetical protein [Chitinophagales bacterium]HRK26654.1 hypothetical protein [Chitinophagales bacterium]